MSIKPALAAAVALACLTGTVAARAEVDPKSIALTLPKDVELPGQDAGTA